MNEAPDSVDAVEPPYPWQGYINMLTYGIWGDVLLRDDQVVGIAEDLIEQRTFTGPVENYYQAAVDALASGCPRLSALDYHDDAVVRDFLPRLVRARDERRPWTRPPFG
jgi:hypothetical protein